VVLKIPIAAKQANTIMNVTVNAPWAGGNCRLGYGSYVAEYGLGRPLRDRLFPIIRRFCRHDWYGSLIGEFLLLQWLSFVGHGESRFHTRGFFSHTTSK
jgi:hypothetical protein